MCRRAAGDPKQVGAALKGCTGVARSKQSFLQIMTQNVEILERPATTGVVFFVRAEVNFWGLESLLSSFECAVLISKWIFEFCDGDPPSEDLKVSLELLNESGSS
ncbi:hypothetical protein EDB80DRAFT_680081 [Ilyonectria destructans]|nr:hypothetical protein EDB80DRAFT_680081 [Ilyonectria destructans]